jgi:mono/diheme cytochrome c family protein
MHGILTGAMTFVTRCAPVLAALAVAGCGGGGGGGEGRRPERDTTPAPPGLTASERAQFERGRQLAVQSGCLACHAIGRAGSDRPGPDLSDIGRRLPPRVIARAMVDPTAPMPSFRSLRRADREALVLYLSRMQVRRDPRRPHIEGHTIRRRP